MEGKEINDEDEESLNEEDIVRIIPLCDNMNGSEVTDIACGLLEAGGMINQSIFLYCWKNISLLICVLDSVRLNCANEQLFQSFPSF